MISIFEKAGVNPRNMSPDISGDASLILNTPAGLLCAVFDGAWVEGFDALKKQDPAFESDSWSSAMAAQTITQVMYSSTSTIEMGEVLEKSVGLYHEETLKLRQAANYSPQLSSSTIPVNYEKLMPQCAGATVLFRNNGDIDITQWGDCFVAFEEQASTYIVTPDQLSSVLKKAKDMPEKPEILLAYQAKVRDLLLSGKTYGDVRSAVHEMAKAEHSPLHFDLWRETDAIIPDDLTGADGFAAWQKTLQGMCQAYNCNLFMNNPDAPMIESDIGTSMPCSWGMLTGEKEMLSLVFKRTVTAEDAKKLKSIYISSDGALGPDSDFIGGVKNTAMNALNDMGPEKYYAKLLDLFNGSKPTNRRFAEDRIPMDVTVIRIPLMNGTPS